MATAAGPVTGREQESGAGGEHEAARIRSEIAHTRAEMGETMEALHGKLNPTVLKEQALEQLHEAKEVVKAEVKAGLEEARTAVREATIGKVENMVQHAEHTMRETSRSIADTVRQNPLPAALTGIGLMWLFLSRRRDQQYVSSGDTLRFGQRSPLELGGRETSSTSEVTQRVEDMAHRAQATLDEARHEAGEKVSHLAQRAKERGRRLENRMEEVYGTSPLAVGAAVLAAGTAIGLAIPISRKEDQWLGKARDRVVHKAQELAHEAMGKVEQATRDTPRDPARSFSGGEPQSQPYNPTRAS